MRKIIDLCAGWSFQKPSTSAESVSLPHTWNALDGQDGGDDYFRGTCLYEKKFPGMELAEDEQVWLEFLGAANTASVTCNGRHIGVHHGGYSTFRFNITDALSPDGNHLQVEVDNSGSDTVYPQKADFTFYGGIYRAVNLITVHRSHFALDDHGSCGLYVTPTEAGADYLVDCLAKVSGGDGLTVCFTVDGIGSVSAKVIGGEARCQLRIPNARRWDGIQDPYLYTLRAVLEGGIDEISTRFGCRSFAFDPQKGFLLNGREYPLRGVSRHQDRENVGNALHVDMHREDLEFVREIGANSVRTAHYQHAPEYYDLLDQQGYVVWAEIPYITRHMPNGRENTLSQMTELILQNYNRPGGVCWALSNEITAASKPDDEDLAENHRLLQALCRKLDPTRKTVMAHTFLLEPNSPLLEIPDLNGYNLYYGWYMGELEDNDAFFDDYHTAHPNHCIGFSEFGADANPGYHSEHPKKGDYTEEYQCLYHEHMLKLLETRPWIWCAYVWNLFDFAADGRKEGGMLGRNQKGLVSFDRKLKKDAFYAYKAWWSKEPFVHVCGSRFVNRSGEKTQIRVYSNQSQVSLYINGQLLETQSGSHVFVFSVPLTGDLNVCARSGELHHEIRICKVAEPDASYCLSGAVVHNWFEDEAFAPITGFYSLKDRMGDIKRSAQGAALVEEIMTKAIASRGEVAKSTRGNANLERMLDRMTMEKLLEQAGTAVFPREAALDIHKRLCMIARED